MKVKLLATLVIAALSAQVYADETMQANPSTAAQAQSSSPKQLGETFLNKNKAKPGVVTLRDGLQYKVLKTGTGAKPGANDVVTVEYEGRLINGQEFDSSSKHGGAATFPVGQVIPGWVEVLQLMPVGSEWEVYVPENLAYGDQGAPPAIGPNETLVFKIKLLKTEKGQ
jgi:FKBP-type peptidyl-prolyl cis-trans isomerase FklB